MEIAFARNVTCIPGGNDIECILHGVRYKCSVHNNSVHGVFELQLQKLPAKSETHELALPFLAVPLPFDVNTFTVNVFPVSTAGSALLIAVSNRSAVNEMPCFFSLSDPLDELRPVMFAPSLHHIAAIKASVAAKTPSEPPSLDEFRCFNRADDGCVLGLCSSTTSNVTDLLVYNSADGSKLCFASLFRAFDFYDPANEMPAKVIMSNVAFPEFFLANTQVIPDTVVPISKMLISKAFLVEVSINSFHLCMFSEIKRTLFFIPMMYSDSVWSIDTTRKAETISCTSYCVSKLDVGPKLRVSVIFYATEELALSCLFLGRRINVVSQLPDKATEICASQSVSGGFVLDIRCGMSFFKCLAHILPTDDLASQFVMTLLSKRQNFALDIIERYAQIVANKTMGGIVSDPALMSWMMFEKAVRGFCHVENSTDWKKETPFSAMLLSDLHKASFYDPCFDSVWVDPPTRDIMSASPEECAKIADIVSVLHTVYEDAKLCTLYEKKRRVLAELLFDLAMSIKWRQHAFFYCADFPDLFARYNACKFEGAPNEQSVFSIYEWIEERIKTRKNSSLAAMVGESTYLPRLEFVGKTYEIMFAPNTEFVDIVKDKTRSLAFLNCVADINNLSSIVSTLPLGVMRPLYAAGNLLRESSIFSVRKNMHLAGVAGRDDYLLYSELLKPNEPKTKENTKILNGICFHKLLRDSDKHVIERKSNPGIFDNTKDFKDGTECSSPLLDLYFFADDRIDEVRKMLSWSRRVLVPVEECSDSSEWITEQQEYLERIQRRTLSLPIGRGAFTLSLDKQNTLDDVLIPHVMIDGRNLSGHDVGFDNPIDRFAMSWPNFHNGVAAGLRLAPDCDPENKAIDVTKIWSLFSKKYDQSEAAAGFLLGVGLQGYLPPSPTARMLEILSAQNTYTTISLLLSASIMNAGTMDDKVSKILFVHVPSLKNATSSVTVAAAGLSKESLNAVPGYGVTSCETVCAVLVSLGYLYRGTCNRMIIEMLLRELTSQPSPRTHKLSECYALCAGLGIGLTTLGRGSTMGNLADMNLLNVFKDLINGYEYDEEAIHIRKNEAFAEERAQRPFLFKVPGTAPICITAPGAIVAMGLMFLKTNDMFAANILKLPQTLAGFESITPLHATLRTLCYHLIMWDSIAVTDEFLESAIPECFQSIEEVLDPDDQLFYNTIMSSIEAGIFLALAFKYAGSGDPQIKNCIMDKLKALVDMLCDPEFEERDLFCDKLFFANVNIVVDNMCIALAVLMSGTCDLECMCLFHTLYDMVNPSDECLYGHFMARNLATGLLFLGGGMLTLSNSNEAIASLLCSLYPSWPTAPSDNETHLQVLRHLYVTAVECRFLVTIDADEQEPCCVPVQFVTSGGAVISATTPCRLPKEDIVEILITPERYFPVTIRKESEDWLVRTGPSKNSDPFVLFVKKREGFLPFNLDRNGYRGPRKEGFVTKMWHSQHSLVGNVENYVFDRDVDRPAAYALTFNKDSPYWNNAVLHCMMHGEKDITPLFGFLWDKGYSLDDTSLELATFTDMQNIRLLCLFDDALLDAEARECLKLRVKSVLKEHTKDILKEYLKNGTIPTGKNAKLFSAALGFFSLPTSREIEKLRTELSQCPTLTGGTLIYLASSNRFICKNSEQLSTLIEFIL